MLVMWVKKGKEVGLGGLSRARSGSRAKPKRPRKYPTNVPNRRPFLGYPRAAHGPSKGRNRAPQGKSRAPQGKSRAPQGERSGIRFDPCWRPLKGALNAQAINNTPHKRACRTLVGALSHLEPASACAWLNWVGWHGHWGMRPP